MKTDPSFAAKVLVKLDELRALVISRERSNRSMDQLSDDIAAIAVRFLRGSHCSGPGCQAGVLKIMPIQTEHYCSNYCVGASTAAAIDTAARIDEAMEEYRGDQNVGNK
jgi:hypothetical protein